MATKADFSASEWQVLRDAPHWVVIAVAAAGGSGLFGSLKEAIAPAGAMIEALKGDNVGFFPVANFDSRRLEWPVTEATRPAGRQLRPPYEKKTRGVELW